MVRIPDCHPAKKHGGHGLCTTCYARERRKDPTIKAKHAEGSRCWRKHHPEFERARSKRRYSADPARLLAATRRWRVKNRDRVNTKRREWRRANPDIYLPKMRAHVKARKAKQKGATVCDFTLQQWEDMKLRYHVTCFYCGNAPERLEQDHVLPLSRGGNHTYKNIVPACSRCNNMKNARTMWEFLGHVAAA